MNRVLVALLVQLAVPLALVAGPALALWRKVTVALSQRVVAPTAEDEAVDPLAADGGLHTLRGDVDSYTTPRGSA